MARLIHTSIASLDGCIEDATGGIEWAAPDAEVHAFVNDLERPIGTYLYGRRMYETMSGWETASEQQGRSAEFLDYANLWRAADKIVFSRTLERVTTARTRIEREFDPTGVRRLKESADRDISVGGAELGGLALRAGLVDELGLLLVPVVIGGGRRALPDGARIDLSLIDERRFRSGAVYLRYAVRNRPE